MTTIFEDKDPVNQNIVDKDTLRNVSQIFLSFFQLYRELQIQVREFLHQNKIIDSMPDNCKVLVMNHELKLSQLL